MGSRVGDGVEMGWRTGEKEQKKMNTTEFT